MAHTLRKYLSCRGSALFMVLSTMTALMICCMAMYFSVVSSRSTQYATFNQQQSYQSAVSISDTLIGGLNDGSLAEFGSLLNGLTNPGDSVTTGSNGFEAFGKTSGIESTDAYDSQLGAYSVTVTRLEDETVAGTTRKTYDVVVTTSVNGVKEAYHTIVYAPIETKEAPPAPTQIFAATGYVPNDVFLTAGAYETDVFFDNEKTVVKAYSNGAMAINGDLSTGGSLVSNGYLNIDPNLNKLLTFAIRGDYISNFNQPLGLPTIDGKKSTVMIGGDAYFNAGGGIANSNIYINGDLYIKSYIDLNTCNYFVNGTVYVDGVWANLSKVRCSNVVQLNGAGINGASPGAWNDGVASQGFLTRAEMLEDLDERTATNIYYKWIIDEEQIPGMSNASNDITIKFGKSNANPKPTCTLTYSNGPARQVSDTEFTGKGFVIKDVVYEATGVDDWMDYRTYTVVIDTGDDPDNTVTIRVKANRDLDEEFGNETFVWKPDGLALDESVNIIVKGKGSVVIDVPAGVTYQDSNFQMMMHYGWFVLGGGTERTLSNGAVVYDPRPIYSLGMAKHYRGFVHTDCHDGDGCVYSETTSLNNCSICGAPKKDINCDIHGRLSEYCPNCQPNLGGDHTGECVNRVGITEIDTFLNSHPDYKTRMTEDGELIYPNTSIFVISSDESADIRLSIKSDGDTIIQNALFGYVYAPYMSFKAFGDGSGGGYIRLMGGMTVSDYIIDQNMSIVGCWPDKMPTDLMSAASKESQLPNYGNHSSWKVKLH